MKRTTFSFVVLCGLVLLAVSALSPAPRPWATRPAPQLLEAMRDVIVGKAAYVGRFKQ